MSNFKKKTPNGVIITKNGGAGELRAPVQKYKSKYIYKFSQFIVFLINIKTNKLFISKSLKIRYPIKTNKII